MLFLLWHSVIPFTKWACIILIFIKLIVLQPNWMTRIAERKTHTDCLFKKPTKISFQMIDLLIKTTVRLFVCSFILSFFFLSFLNVEMMRSVLYFSKNDSRLGWRLEIDLVLRGSGRKLENSWARSCFIEFFQELMKTQVFKTTFQFTYTGILSSVWIR